MGGAPHRQSLTRATAVGAVAALAALIWACASQAPQLASVPQPTSAAVPPPAPEAAATPEWNIFPDFTTGKIDVYKDGEYVGSITGDEPEDPPMPHKDPRQLDPTFP